MVLGVSVSSLVLQNSLFEFLQRFVEGADKEKVEFTTPVWYKRVSEKLTWTRSSSKCVRISRPLQSYLLRTVSRSSKLTRRV